MAFWSWSKTAASNATADTSINWAEGQSPSSVNDSARAMMARLAEYRDDISAFFVTGGTGAAYTVTSSQGFDSFANMNRAMIGFVPLSTNTGPVTLNVDGLGAKPLRSANLAELPAGSLVAGSPYTATYNNGNGEWYVHNYFKNPQSEIPIGGIIQYAGATAPNSNFAIPIGQAISRTTYATLFTLIGTTYGVGDGSTTFNLPDLGGRAIFGKEATATRLTTAGGGIDGGTLGAVGGAQNVTLTASQIPTHNSAGTNSISVVSPNIVATTASALIDGTSNVPGSGFRYMDSSSAKAAVTSTGSNSILTTYTNSSQVATKTVPPGIVLNHIMRVL